MHVPGTLELVLILASLLAYIFLNEGYENIRAMLY